MSKKDVNKTPVSVYKSSKDVNDKTISDMFEGENSSLAKTFREATMSDKTISEATLKMKLWNRLNKRLNESGNPDVWIKEFDLIVDEVEKHCIERVLEEVKDYLYGLESVPWEEQVDEFIKLLKQGD